MRTRGAGSENDFKENELGSSVFEEPSEICWRRGKKERLFRLPKSHQQGKTPVQLHIKCLRPFPLGTASLLLLGP